MKIATWNVNSLRVRLEHLLTWLEQTAPDVVALQETKCEDAAFPLEALQQAGYQVSFAGQKTYNGVAVLSKYPMEDVCVDLPGLEDPQRRVLGVTLTCGAQTLRLLNLYVPNGSSIDSPKYQYKLGWLDKLHAYTSEQLQQYPNLVLLGDFNIAPADIDVHDPAAWQDKVLVSKPERTALQALLNLGLTDSLRQMTEEQCFSWWDYRAAAFRRNLGLRIDLILASEALASTCQACEVDKTPRTWERPSDHAPVVAEFACY